MPKPNFMDQDWKGYEGEKTAEAAQSYAKDSAWTKDAPIVPGFYWLRNYSVKQGVSPVAGLSVETEPTIVHCEDHSGTVVEFYHPGSEVGIRIDHLIQGEWSGPIAPPPSSATKTTDFPAGAQVQYIPPGTCHLPEDPRPGFHRDYAVGRVSSTSDQYVFVKFDGDVAAHGWDAATAKPCRPEDLRII